MLLLLFLSIPIIFISIYFLDHQKQKKYQLLRPPGPPGLPFIGNLHQFLNITSTPHEYLWKLSKKYGPVMSMRFGSIPVVIISSASAAEQALKDQDLAFSGRPTTLSMHKFSYNGLDFAFNPHGGQYWKEMRKIAVTNLCSSKRVQSFRPIREDEISILIKQIHEESTKKSSDDDELVTINVSEMVISFARNLICRISFGKRVPVKDVFEKKRTFKELFRESQGLLATFFYSDYFPWFGWVVDKLRGVTGKLDKNFREFDYFYQEIIDEHLNKKHNREEEEEEEEDIIDILLKLRSEKSTPFHLSFDHIKAMLMNIVVPGTDPVSATIVWTMTALMQNPIAMDNLREEIRKLIGNKGKVDEEDIQKLPYLKAVILETLRLYPPVPLLLPRKTLQPCTIDTYQIQPKTLVYFNEWAIARDPKYWENPNEFSPERFLELGRRSVYNYNNYEVQNFALIPFGAGRRICPGSNLGMAAVELAIANLVYSFHWKLPRGMKEEDIDLDVAPGFTMHKKNDLCLVVAKSYGIGSG